MAKWMDNGGSMGCETPETACNGAMDELQHLARTIEYRPNGDGTYLCSCGRHFVNFGKFAEHATQSDGAHALTRLSIGDSINHPPHYTFGKIEVISVIEDWGLSFHLAQVVKYVARSKHKGNELEDLRKAQFYLNRLITSLEKK